MEHSIPLTQKIRKISVSDIKPSFGTFSFIADFFMITASFFIFHYIRSGAWIPSGNYLVILLLIYGVWLAVSMFMKKYRKQNYGKFGDAFLIAIKSTGYMAYIISFAVTFFELFAFSRAMVFGTCVLYGILQVNWFALLFLVRGKELALAGVQEGHSLKPHYPFSVRRFVADFLLLTAAFYLLNYIKRETFVLSNEYQKAFLMVLGVWFISSLYTGKFSSRKYANFIHAIMPYVKAVIVSVMVMSVVIFLFRMFYFSRLHIFGTFLSLGLAEILLRFFYSDLPIKTTRRDIETVEETQEIFQQEESHPHEADVAEPVGQSHELIRERLKHHLLKDKQELFEFLDSNIDMSKIDADSSVVLDTHTLYNVETIEDGSLTLFINLERLNNMRRINRYLLEVHKKFYNGSYFIGCAETINTHYNRIISKYPKYFAETIYALDFLIFRVLPKIPFINKIYFLFSKGRNRVISDAEVLGRLYFCGFEVLASAAINKELYFIARKAKQPTINQSPSYGPLIKLRRIGYNGNVIYINKLRTMHPYSEYLQGYVYEQNRLQLNGKFNSDFRVTQWGKIFRKLWIDELPQISNFMHGDISLVGVRALSEHYFNLYPEDLQELRIKFKPGLVPPYYADMPNSFEEILESERQYLLAKQRKPFTTDVKYFSKALYNIFFKKARSR